MGKHRRIPEEQRVAFNQQIIREHIDPAIVPQKTFDIAAHMARYEKILRVTNDRCLRVLSECELQKMIRQELLDTFSVEVQKELRKVGA